MTMKLSLLFSTSLLLIVVNGFSLDIRNTDEILDQLLVKHQNNVQTVRLKRSSPWLQENGSARGTESPTTITTTTSPPPLTHPMTSSTTSYTPSTLNQQPIVTLSPPVVVISRICKVTPRLCRLGGFFNRPF